MLRFFLVFAWFAFFLYLLYNFRICCHLISVSLYIEAPCGQILIRIVIPLGTLWHGHLNPGRWRNGTSGLFYTIECVWVCANLRKNKHTPHTVISAKIASTNMVMKCITHTHTHYGWRKMAIGVEHVLWVVGRRTPRDEPIWLTGTFVEKVS